jgi:hypothetical protein
MFHVKHARPSLCRRLAHSGVSVDGIELPAEVGGRMRVARTAHGLAGER